METVFLCYAEADREFAADLAAFLERGANVQVYLDDGIVPANGSLIEKARDGRMADIVVVILSPDSVPRKWARKEWEEAFIEGPAEENVKIAFLLRAECPFPPILRRQAFFEDRRALKRWIRTGERLAPGVPADLESLAASLADRPGIATGKLANEFVAHCSGDFDAVLWLSCSDRSLAQLAGDLGSQLGLRLEGEPLSNAKRIRDFCRERRFLIVLTDAHTPEAAALACEGRSSTLLTDAPVKERELAGLERIQRAFTVALENNWDEACSLAREGARLARDRHRVAEAFELMEALYRAAQGRGDHRIVEETAREQIWILEQWDRLEEADGLRGYAGARHARQLAFEF
ncbi:MAG: toll/interleukin-1 receptor domain-containing protein [Bryobacteraceae bacterium]